MKSSTLLHLSGSVLILLDTVIAQELPYNPTRIFLTEPDADAAYILQPGSGAGISPSLAVLDLGEIDASAPSLTTIYPSLPFVTSAVNTPLNAVIDGAGNITVYTGSCNSSGEIWTYSTGEEEEHRDWVRRPLSSTDNGSGLSFLAAGTAFSSNVTATASSTDFYFFGGMCPSTGAAPTSWTSAASYSKDMFVLEPSTDGEVMEYMSSLATTRNLPIAQAGHTLTALLPTYANHSDGSQTQQQDFVLIGGHTQSAFINMSQVALWSLPQEAWSYFPIEQGDSATQTELAIRQPIVQIEPRSGHTAVLSSDGTKIVVFGGWVGDINTPAEPQLAILNVADSYGGTGDWSWSAPELDATNGLASGTGLYGHGAVMLPGNIMMVLGGYTIGSSNNVRRDGNPLNSHALLLNVSSNTWLSSYDRAQAPANAQESNSGPLSRTSQKAGLGIGLGLGAAAVGALILVYLWYVRRNRRLREEREQEIKELTNGSDTEGWPPVYGHYTQIPVMEQRDGPYPITDQQKLAQAHQRGWRSTANEAERTGLLVEVPSPTRGLRRNVSHGRGPSSYDKRRSRNMEVIEEKHDQEDIRSMASHRDFREGGNNHPQPEPDSDVVADPSNPLRSHPVSPEHSPRAEHSAREREREVRGWVDGWEKAAGALIYGPSASQQADDGRSSPSKSDRTTSMLSESSDHSTWSSRSGGRPQSGMVRTLSTRSAALLNSLTTSFMGPSSPTGEYSEEDARNTLPSQRRRRGNSFNTSPIRSRPDTAVSVMRSDAGDSFSTAPTSFVQLQAEGEALLGGYGRSRNKSEPSSPIKEKKDMGWYGSVKRAISGSKAPSPTPGTRSGNVSPDKPSSRDGEQQFPPRRAASDASFLRSRKGARDWSVEDDEDIETLQRPSAPNDQHDDDWDVERAAENRVVQLMFTVPRQRLRVVNADDDDNESRRAS